MPKALKSTSGQEEDPPIPDPPNPDLDWEKVNRRRSGKDKAKSNSHNCDRCHSKESAKISPKGPSLTQQSP
jgi:hypothetical protein